MNRTCIVIASTISAVLATAGLAVAEDRNAAFGISGNRGSNYEIMSPGNGLSLLLGSQRAIAVFETKNDACQLKIVLADAEQNASGAQIVVPVLSGSTLQLNTAEGKTAEYSCDLAGTKMDARVLEQPRYRS